MKGPFDVFKCELGVGAYLRSGGSAYKGCLDYHLRKIKEGKTDICSINDNTKPDLHYYIECNHYILISVSLRNHKNKKAIILEIKRYP